MCTGCGNRYTGVFLSVPSTMIVCALSLLLPIPDHTCSMSVLTVLLQGIWTGDVVRFTAALNLRRNHVFQR